MRQTVTRWCKRLIEAAIGPIQTDITQLEADVLALQADQTDTNTNLSRLNGKAAAGTVGAGGVVVTMAPGLLQLATSSATYTDTAANASRLTFIVQPQGTSGVNNVTFSVTRNGVNIQNVTLDINAYQLTLGFCPIEWYFWRNPAPFQGNVFCAPVLTDPTTYERRWQPYSNAPVAADTTLWGLECSPLSNTGQQFTVTGIAWETLVAVPLL